MGQLEVDASNSCIPATCNVSALCPPLPTAVRGEPCVLDGHGGRINSDRPVLLYSSGRLVVVRELDDDVAGDDAAATTAAVAVAKWKGGIERPAKVRAFVYRGHTAQVTAARFSPSGCYVASADLRGRLRVWSYDNEEHLCRLDLSTALAGPIRDIAWDFESKRLCIVGEGSKTDASSVCARVIQWDTGVTCGELGQHTRNRASTCAFKPNRPMRIATGGADDSRVLFNKGPPFTRVVDGSVAEQEHSRGSVNRIRYSRDGTKIVSVGTDKSVVFYDGKTMQLLHKMTDVHTHSIYMCDWNSDGKFVITASADGTVKLIDASSYAVVHTWDIASTRQNATGLTAARASDAASASATPPVSPRIPMGAMQMGCAFVKGDVPVSVSLSGQISLLSVPQGLIENSDAIRLEDDRLLSGHQAAISSFAFNASTNTLYSGDTDGVICSWNLSSVKSLGRARLGGDETHDITLMDKVQGGAITSMVYVNDTLLSSGWDDKVRFGSGRRGKDLVMEQSVKLDAQPNAMAKGNELVCCLTVKGALLLKGNQVVSDLISLPYGALSVCVSSDDSMVIIGGDDCKIYIYKVEMSDPSSLGLKEDHVIENGHLKAIHALEMSHDGKMLASADVRDVCVWSIEDGWSPLVAKGRWCFHTQRITCLAWSQDDSVLASGGNDDSIYLWSISKRMKRVHYPFAHRGGIAALEFLDSNDGMVLVSAGSDACLCQWDVTNDIASKFG
mmetsp:Transcript_22140/g.48228  ORF Transcript_22140/g.48228 Transcript_22140/m.48228 type:complete len:730 (-) Transcript_22140:2269-4458(-)